MDKFKNQFLLFFNKKEQKKIYFLFFLMFLASFLELLGLGMILPITSVFLDASSSVYTNFFENSFLSNYFNSETLIYFLLIIFFTIYLFKISTLLFISWYQQKLLYNLKYNISNKFYFNYITEDYSFYRNKNTAGFIRNIMSEVDNLINFYLSTVSIVLELVVLISLSIFLLYINISVTLISFTFFAAVAITYFSLIKKRLSNWGYQRQKIDEKKIKFLQEGFGAFKEIKIMGRENFFYENFRNQNFDYASISLRVNFLNQVPRHLFDFTAIVMIIIIFLVLKILGLDFSETFSLLALYLAAAFRLIPATNRLLYGLQTIKFFYPSLDILSKEILSFTEKFKIQKSNIIRKANFKNSIYIDIKDFKYSGEDIFGLKNIKFEISKNSKIGIIGKSGSGKSTLIENIAGILKPTSGDIKVDGRSIYENKRDWMNILAYIPQKIFILDDSLKNNILFGADSKLYDDKYIIELLEKTNLKHLLKKLKNGLNHNLGEKGVNLSVGEVQRVGIARAFLNDPEIVILDEATSSLDTFTESKILNEIYKFEKTFISVAHRIGTLKKSDLIIKIDDGKIIEQGKFSQFENK